MSWKPTSVSIPVWLRDIGFETNISKYTSVAKGYRACETNISKYTSVA